LSKVTRRNKNEQFVVIFLGEYSPVMSDFRDWINERRDVLYSEDHPKLDHTIRVVFRKGEDFDFKSIFGQVMIKTEELGIVFIRMVETTTFFPRTDELWRD
jgi:hypothetical protein